MSHLHPSPVRRFFGFALLSVGALIATLCGLCTGFFMVAGIVDQREMFVMALVIGGIPTAIGVAMVVFGRRLLRPANIQSRGLRSDVK